MENDLSSAITAIEGGLLVESAMEEAVTAVSHVMELDAKNVLFVMVKVGTAATCVGVEELIHKVKPVSFVKAEACKIASIVKAEDLNIAPCVKAEV